MGGKKASPISLVGMYIGTATAENNTEIFQKTTNRTPYDPAILLLGIYWEKVLIQKYTCISTFIAMYLQLPKYEAT